MATPLDLGPRRELFVDAAAVDRLERAVRVLHPPQRRELVWQNDSGSAVGPAYFNFFHDGPVVRMYYRGFCGADDDPDTTANYLESHDRGLTFAAPNLGQQIVAGRRVRNVVFRGVQAHNLFVFRDDNPATPPEQRYKAVGGHWVKLFGLVSPDGLRWRLIRDEPLAVKGTFDSLNVVSWDASRGRYRMFSRYFYEQNKVAIRAIQVCESDDFINWDEPKPFEYAPGTPVEQFYTNAAMPCPGAEQILLAFPKRFVPDRTLSTEGMPYPSNGLSDAVLMSSRDGVQWDRTFLEAWARPGPDPRNWTHRSNMPAAGIALTAPDEWSMYISEHYGWPTTRLRRLAVRPWGFASVRAGVESGELLTSPLRLGAGGLRLNFSTSAVGCVAVEAQDQAGQPILGFGLDAAPRRFGDSIDTEYAWPNADFRALAGRTVRLRFLLRDADLFAFRVA